MPSLEQDYPQGLLKLNTLFGEGTVNAFFPRLNEIYNVVEEKWNLNIERFLSSGTPIKYVLIGEAPPFSHVGEEVSYFYNACETNWCGRITRAFFYYHPTPLDELVNHQFILFDTLPFSMKYKTYDRKKQAYKEMVQACFDYFNRKVNDSRLTWDKDVKVAFAVQYHYYAFREAVKDYTYTFPNGQKVYLTEDRVATDGTGYPSSSELRRVFELDKDH